MRPQLLKISGLNSFIQEEIIDFNRLTEKGLFGIFGPTGSGKSSILDAITLALYGEISRDTSEFINTETGELYVKFRFTINNGQKSYSVERKMKLKDSGGYRTTFARLIKFKDNEKEIIDGVREIEENIENIIGLNHADFMRTVVLPQGEFSKFLKLTGRSRRDMLERILGLEEFGEKLMSKLKSKRTFCQQELNGIEQVLKKYDDVSKKKLANERENLEQIKTKLKEANHALNEKRKQYEKYKKVWQLKSTLMKYQEKYNRLSEQQSTIKVKKNRLENVKKAVSIKNDLKRYERYLKDKQSANKELITLNEKIVKCQEQKNKLEEDYKKSVEKKDKELPTLTKKEIEIQEAKKIAEENLKLRQKILEKKKTLQQLKQKKESVRTKLLKIEENIQVYKNEIEEKENKLGILQITSDYREQINSGLSLEKDYLQTKQEIKKSQTIVENIKEQISKTKSKLAREKDNLILVEAKILNKYKSEIKEKTSSKETISSKIKCLNEELDKKSEDLKSLINLIDEIEKKNMASVLANNLNEGMPCPVCGSKEHPEIIEYHNEDLTEKKNSKVRLDKEIEELKENKNKYSARLSIIEKELEKLEQEREQELTKFENDKEKVSNLKLKVENVDDLLLNDLQDKKIDIKEEIIKLEERLNKEQESLSDKQIEYEKLKHKQNKRKDQYDQLLNEFEIESFNKESNQISNKDKKREQIELELKRIKKDYDKKIQEREQKQIKLNKLETELVKEKNKFEHMVDIFNNNQQKINTKAGDNDPDLYLSEIKKKKNNLKENIKIKKQDFENISNKVNNYSGDKKVVEERLENLKNELEELKIYLDNKIQEFEFKNIDEAKNYLKWENQVNEWQQQIEAFEKKLTDVKNNIERLQNELGNESLSKEKWLNIQEQKEELEDNHNKLQEEVGAYKNKISKLQEDLKEKMEQKQRKKELDHELDLLMDINDLVRGKNFVEFVAVRQLRYIALEASKRLMNITNNRYKLELNDQGEFVVCDNYNGGVKRDCNTLSGGETFLTSLSLALALSSQIQLRGSSNMEFFFLDEGFGTLDSNLLDIVMKSLEDLQRENLAVGIISHVEELKNRVPAKLMVTPAEAGLHGTKVNIEYS